MSETNAPDWNCPDCGRCECSKVDLEDYDDEEGLAAWRDAVQACNDAERKKLRSELAAIREANAALQARLEKARVVLDELELHSFAMMPRAIRSALGLEVKP